MDATTAVPPAPEPEKTPPGFEVRIEGVTHDGRGIARIGGEVTFVAGVIPGELVRIQLQRHRKGYAVAVLQEVLEPSPHRVTPPCPYVGPCGGCSWQHVAYPEQLRLKQHIVQEQFRRIGHLTDVEVLPVIGMDDPWGYRNHARFSVGRKHGDIGFMQAGTHRLVPIRHCLLMAPAINEALAWFQERKVPSTALNLRYGVNTGDLMIQPAFPDDRYPTGQPTYREVLAGVSFEISAPAFFQVNTRQAEVLVRLVQEGLALQPGESVADVYAGVGTFAAVLAPLAQEVFYIEESGPAYRNAMANLGPFPNVELLAGKAEDVFPTLPAVPDAVVVDPPRTGCHRRLVDALVALGPSRIAYVSCDPGTLARDLRLLHDGGYRIGPVQPVDMFPHTWHVECVVILHRGPHWQPPAPPTAGGEDEATTP